MYIRVSMEVSTQNSSNKQTKPKATKKNKTCLHNNILLRMSNKRRQKRSCASPTILKEKSKVNKT